MKTLSTLKEIRKVCDERLVVLRGLKQKFLDSNDDGGFMSETQDTQYDADITALSLVRSYANDAINDIEFNINNPETLDKNYDPAVS